MSFDPLAILQSRCRAAIARAFPNVADPDPLIAPSRNPKFGDFQCNAAMSVAKAAGISSRDAAAAIVANLDLRDIAEPLGQGSIAGPGFINITLRADALSALLQSMQREKLGLAEASQERETVVVDLCGVNLAKAMHVGHLRSIIIGDSLARIWTRLGHRVIRQNHVGDWGLPIAMVTERLIQEKARGRDLANLDLDTLERLYKSAQSDCQADHAGLAAAERWSMGPKALAELQEQVNGAGEALSRAKATLVKLQSGDAPTVAVWKRISDITMDACLTVCRRLDVDVTTEHSAGESSYAAELAPLVDDLLARGIAEISEGAVVVRVDGVEEPCLIRKSERGGGGFLYATTDMAAIRRRIQVLGASRVIYCVDVRQGLHFRQVFGAAARAGFTRRADGHGEGVLRHAGFGMVLGDDNRPFKTRSGENIKLSDLLDEATSRAGAAVAEKNPDLAADERSAIAEAVGIGAIKYVDLSSDRAKDYVFNFDRMLAFEGNTGPYLQYALVRIRSILRKGAERAEASGTPGAQVPEEKALALVLLRYPATVRAAAESLEPHRICQHLYELAQAISVFVTNCPVLSAPEAEVRSRRLGLCALAERVLADGLGLLGLATLERM